MLLLLPLVHSLKYPNSRPFPASWLAPGSHLIASGVCWALCFVLKAVSQALHHSCGVLVSLPMEACVVLALVSVWQVTWGNAVRRMWMSVPQSPVTTEVCASNDPTRATMGRSQTSPTSSATAKLLVSSAGANQALKVTSTLACALPRAKDSCTG